MMLKYIAAGLTASALLVGVAFAETPNALSQSSLQGSTWRASKVVGLSVYNDKSEKIGSINDLLMDKSGNIKAAVIGVGGFLGMGEHLVAVSFNELKFSDQPVSNATASNANPPPASNRPSGTTTTGSANTANPPPAAKPNPWYPDHAVFNTTKDELQKMQEFKYSNQ
jgi:sporulation protein YlmC with PRC-barrel domain